MRRTLALMLSVGSLGLTAGSVLAESGDVNGDGRVDQADVRLVEQYLGGDLLLQDAQIAAADADRDGKITRKDQALIERRVAGLSFKPASRGGAGQLTLESTDGGTVTDKTTGKPLAGVEVSLLDEGITVRTDSQGRFKLPRSAPGKILTARASAYAPGAVSTQTGRGGLELKLEKLSPRLQVLDDDLHHLGDDRFGPGSANYADFKLPSEGNRYERSFGLSALPQTDLTLHIGSVIGLDTPQSAAAGQSSVQFFGTRQDGLRVFLNDNLVQQVYINGDSIAVTLPRWLLQPGPNRLRIETHLFQSPGILSNSGGLGGLFGLFGFGRSGIPMGGDVIDYDDIEFAHLVIEDPSGNFKGFTSRGEVYRPQRRPDF